MLLVDNLIFVSGAGKGVERDFRSLLFQGRRGTDNPGVILLVLLFT